MIERPVWISSYAFIKIFFSLPCLLYTKEERNDQTFEMWSLVKASWRGFCEHRFYAVKEAVTSVNSLVSHYLSSIPSNEVKNKRLRSSCGWWKFRVLLDSLENQLSGFFCVCAINQRLNGGTIVFCPSKIFLRSSVTLYTYDIYFQ